MSGTPCGAPDVIVRDVPPTYRQALQASRAVSLFRMTPRMSRERRRGGEGRSIGKGMALAALLVQHTAAQPRRRREVSPARWSTVWSTPPRGFRASFRAALPAPPCICRDALVLSSFSSTKLCRTSPQQAQMHRHPLRTDSSRARVLKLCHKPHKTQCSSSSRSCPATSEIRSICCFSAPLTGATTASSPPYFIQRATRVAFRRLGWP